MQQIVAIDLQTAPGAVFTQFISGVFCDGTVVATEYGPKAIVTYDPTGPSRQYEFHALGESQLVPDRGYLLGAFDTEEWGVLIFFVREI